MFVAAAQRRHEKEKETNIGIYTEAAMEETNTSRRQVAF